MSDYIDKIINEFHHRASENGLRRFFDVQLFEISLDKKNEFLIDCFDNNIYYSIKNSKKYIVDETKIENISLLPFTFRKICLNLEDNFIDYGIDQLRLKSEKKNEINSEVERMIRIEDNFILKILNSINPLFDLKYSNEKIGIIGMGMINNIPKNRRIQSADLYSLLAETKLRQFINFLIKKDIVFPPKKNIFELLDI